MLESTERPLVPQESYLSRNYGEETAQMINITQVKEGAGVSPDRASEISGNNVFKDENKSRLSQRSHNTTKSVITQNNTAALLNASKASKGLKKALEAAQAINANNSEIVLNKLMKEQALSNDLRLTIFACFYRVGFDLHDLTPAEKQRMEIIQLYPYLKNGEIWMDIKQELVDTNLRPTGDDRHWLETSIEEAIEQTEKAVHNQELFSQDVKNKELDDLEAYFGTVRLKNEPQTAKQMGASKKAKKTAK